MIGTNSANRILAILDVFTEGRLEWTRTSLPSLEDWQAAEKRRCGWLTLDGEYDCCFAKQMPVAAGLCYLRRGDRYLLLVQQG